MLVDTDQRFELGLKIIALGKGRNPPVPALGDSLAKGAQKITFADDADNPSSFVADRDRADGVLHEKPRDLLQRSVRRDRDHVPRHDILDSNTHFFLL
ncbi:hypothetical protein D3C87_1729050 [compost metagenome]|jgi:hypothetical protein